MQSADRFQDIKGRMNEDNAWGRAIEMSKNPCPECGSSRSWEYPHLL